MKKEEAERCPGASSNGVGGLLGSVPSNVQPIEGEGNDQGTDCFGIAEGEADVGWGADDDAVEELPEDLSLS